MQLCIKKNNAMHDVNGLINNTTIKLYIYIKKLCNKNTADHRWIKDFFVCLKLEQIRFLWASVLGCEKAEQCYLFLYAYDIVSAQNMNIYLAKK